MPYAGVYPAGWPGLGRIPRLKLKFTRWPASILARRLESFASVNDGFDCIRLTDRGLSERSC